MVEASLSCSDNIRIDLRITAFHGRNSDFRIDRPPPVIWTSARSRLKEPVHSGLRCYVYIQDPIASAD